MTKIWKISINDDKGSNQGSNYRTILPYIQKYYHIHRNITIHRQILTNIQKYCHAYRTIPFIY